MNFRKWTRPFLLIPLLLSILNFTPAQANGPSQAANTAKVIWCPAAVTLPKSGSEGCTPAFDMLTGPNGLLTYLTAHIPSQAGVVWIGKTYNSSSVLDTNVLFDGATLGKMAKYTITIKGGWNGPNKSTLDLQSPSTLDGVSLNIINWKRNVTVKGVLIKNTTSFVAGCGVISICVETTGNIQLDHVQIKGPNPNAASLDNTTSVTSPPGSVTVMNSQFSDTTYEGLYIDTRGAATFKNVTISGTGYGAFINNTSDATASPVTVSNGQFNGNGAQGLNILSNGKVTITKVHAEDNGADGVYVNNTSGSGDVLVNGANTFLGNNGSGLLVRSNGSVTASYLMAFQNGQYGADIQNQTSPSAKGVTITRGGDFMGNSWGLYVNSKGNLSLNRINGSSNINYGIILQTDGSATLTCSSAYGNFTAVQTRASNGLDPLLKLTLQGFLSYGNTVGNTPNEDFLATSVTRTTCPYP